MGWFSRKKEAPAQRSPQERYNRLRELGWSEYDASRETGVYPTSGNSPDFSGGWCGDSAVCTPSRHNQITGWQREADERAEYLAMGERTRESMDVPQAWAAPEPKSWAAPTPARWEAPVEQPYHAPERINVQAPAEIPVPTNAVSSRTFDVPLSNEPVTIPMMDVGYGYKVPVFGGGHQAQPAPVEEAPIPVQEVGLFAWLFGAQK